MNFTDYQAAAARTMQPATGIRTEDRHARLILALGLISEAGEATEIIKKHEGHGHDLDREKLAEECSDVLWYLAAVATSYGISLDAAAQANIEKLKRRYPSGFSQAASRQRVDKAPAPATRTSVGVSYCEACKPLNRCCNCMGGRECGTMDCPPCGNRQAVTQ